MENRRKLRTLILYIFLISTVIAALTLILLKINQKEIVQVINVKYDSTNLINAAMNKLKEDNKRADIITDVKTIQKVVALDFKGFSDTQTNQKILDLLEEHNRKATFFIPGIEAAEDSDMVQAIYQNGHRVGSNTLSVTKNMEDYSKEELVEDFCRANNILSTYTNEIPSLLECNSTEYTDELLQAAYASGNKKVVSSNHYLNYKSFTSYEQVLDYVRSLEKGAIVTIKMKGELDDTEYEEKEVDEDPAIDKQAGVEVSEEESTLTEEDKLIQIVEWLLKALDETKYDTVFVEDLYTHDDPDFAKSFEDVRGENAGALSTVYKRIRTGKNLVSFSFRGVSNEETLLEVLDYLDSNEITATFFVTAEDIIEYPDRIKMIIEKGHNIANGGMTGKDVTKMNYKDICLEIYKCNKLLEEKFDIHTNLYMPVYGKYNDLVREAASSLGYSVVTYSKNPITDDRQSVTDIMNYFKNGFANGDIIYFRLDYHDDVLEVLEKTYAKIQDSKLNLCGVNILVANENKGFYTVLEHNTANENISHVDNKKKKNIEDKIKNSIEYVNNNAKDNEKEDSKGSNNNVEETKQIDLIKEEEKINWPTYTKRQLFTLRIKNNGKIASQNNIIYTTEQALAFTFYGIQNSVVLEDVLEKMDELNAKGTFFVTKDDVLNRKDVIKEIVEKGHDVGITLNGNTDIDYATVCNAIHGIQIKLKEITGQTSKVVRYPYNNQPNNEILEAISSMGCQLVWQDVALANSKAGQDSDLKTVLRYTFNDGNISAQRGDIFYFRLDYYNDPFLIGNLMKDIVKNRINTLTYVDGTTNNSSSYSIKTLSSIMNSDKVYDYPVKVANIIPDVKNAISEGHLAELTEEDKFRYLKGRYIGTPSVSTLTTLPGFNDTELFQLDKTGVFTNDRVIFLTFDDWGSDKPINQLLYVLKKYNVKANFFIRTSYVQNNPNLLRAIAEDGHDIGSHSDAHVAFANPATSDDIYNVQGTFTSLNEAEVAGRKEDLQLSYNKLQSIIGDVQVNGMPSLTKIFRPPTLAMSKSGMEAIFDMGFKYIVSGDFSTHDYEAKSQEALVNELLNGIVNSSGSVSTLQNGSIVVLHMSDDSITPSDTPDLTAAALDVAIPKLLERGYHFAKLSEYLSDGTGAVK